MKFETDEDDKRGKRKGIPRVVQRERAVSHLFFLILTKPKALFQSLAD